MISQTQLLKTGLAKQVTQDCCRALFFFNYLQELADAGHVKCVCDRIHLFSWNIKIMGTRNLSELLVDSFFSLLSTPQFVILKFFNRDLLCLQQIFD